MAIFKKPAIKAEGKKREMPRGVFQKGPGCGQVVPEIELAQNQRVAKLALAALFEYQLRRLLDCVTPHHATGAAVYHLPMFDRRTRFEQVIDFELVESAAREDLYLRKPGLV